MIHSIWILSVSYHILTYFLFFESYYHYTTYAIILIIHTVRLNPSRCPSVVIRNTIFIRNTVITVTIHICCSILFHTLPSIRGQHSVLVIAIHTCKCALLILGPLHFGILHRYIYSHYLFSFCKICYSEKYRRLLVIVLQLVDRLVRYCSDITQYSYYSDYFI